MKISKKHLGLPACGVGTYKVYRTLRFLEKKIGRLDIEPEKGRARKKDWQAMLQGLKPGDKVKVIWAIIKDKA